LNGQFLLFVKFPSKQQHANKQTINAFVRFKEEDSAKNAATELFAINIIKILL